MIKHAVTMIGIGGVAFYTAVAVIDKNNANNGDNDSIININYNAKTNSNSKLTSKVQAHNAEPYEDSKSCPISKLLPKLFASPKMNNDNVIPCGWVTFPEVDHQALSIGSSLLDNDLVNIETNYEHCEECDNKEDDVADVEADVGCSYIPLYEEENHDANEYQ